MRTMTVSRVSKTLQISICTVPRRPSSYAAEERSELGTRSRADAAVSPSQRESHPAGMSSDTPAEITPSWTVPSRDWISRALPEGQ